jgi:hypothetical protein
MNTFYNALVLLSISFYGLSVFATLVSSGEKRREFRETSNSLGIATLLLFAAKSNMNKN